MVDRGRSSATASAAAGSGPVRERCVQQPQGRVGGGDGAHRCLGYQTEFARRHPASGAPRGGVMNHERHRRRRHRSRLDRGRRGRGPPRRGRPAVRRTPSRRSRRAARSSTSSPPTPRRTTASPPASARWPPCRSRPRSVATCSAAWSARTPPSTGPEVEREVVRALMLLRLSTLATGHTGVRPETASAYAAMLDAGLTPVVREYGSLGCSGDLAPLAHCALALMGEGEVRDASGCARRAASAQVAHADREGGPRPHQRHRRHARHARAGAARPGDTSSTRPTSPPR